MNDEWRQADLSIDLRKIDLQKILKIVSEDSPTMKRSSTNPLQANLDGFKLSQTS